MKVALNPAELRLIVDALDDKRQFQLQSGEGRVEWGSAHAISAGDDVDFYVVAIFGCHLI
jgi:hypothetical protein